MRSSLNRRNDKKVTAQSQAPAGSVSARHGLICSLRKCSEIKETPLTTHTFDFRDLDKGFRMMSSKADGIIKPLILF